MIAVLRQTLFWSAVVEFALLRIFLRLGPMLPVSEPLLVVYRTLEVLGVAALNLALLSAAALAALLLGQRLAPRGPTTGEPSVLAAAGEPALGGWLPVGLIAGAQVLALYYVLAQAAASAGMALPGQGSVFLAAEALAVTAALVLPWSYRPPRIPWRPRHLALGGLLGLVFLAALVARPWTLATMSIWTVGFTLFLPGAIYAVALASAAATAWALSAGGDRGRTAALGLLLVAMAGVKLDSTYNAALAVAGTLLLIQAISATTRPVRNLRWSTEFMGNQVPTRTR